MIQNLDTRLNKLQTQCDYLRRKISAFPEGELSIQKNGSYQRWIIRKEEQSVYCPKSNRSLAEIMALKKYYSLLLLEAEEEFSLQKWCAESYETNSSHPENLIHTTLAGHKVRSKSEVIIANLLYTNHIPYRYEAALALNELTVYPDFTILHPTTQQFFYWEHFGMMDKNNYCDAACNKLKSYCYNGIFPSMQLITTYETGKVPIRSEQVQQIITQYFL